jgi:hypothetical protein
MKFDEEYMKILEKISNCLFFGEYLKNIKKYREFWNFGEYLKIFEECDGCKGILK